MSRLTIYVCIYSLLVGDWIVKAATYINPVIDSNNPDPGVLAMPDGGGYLAVATSNDTVSKTHDNAFPIYHSTDLVNWVQHGFVFTGESGNWPVWANCYMCAPEIHWVNGRYLVYFCARQQNVRHSIGVAVSQTDSPYGPYQDLGVPIVTYEEDSIGGAIDPHYFQDPVTGKDYLVWKTDSYLALIGSIIYLRELTKEGTAFVEGSQPISLIQNDRLDEALVCEGAWLMYQYETGWYFLFYSSSWFSLPYYHTKVARSKSIQGPYEKWDTPVIETDWDRYNNNQNSTFEGPGHGSVVSDAAGDWWYVYHSWRYGHLNREPGRVMLLDKISWNEGWPWIGVPSDTPQEKPSVK